MVEIKSTLELVMERTRHLTLTEQDKREQALAEFKKSLNGLLTRFHDGSVGLDQFQAELRSLQKHSHITDRSTVIGEIFSRLDLDGDNAWALNLLEEAFGMNIEGIGAVLKEYQKAVDSMTQTRMSELRTNLLEQHGISGSAVIPNYAAYPDWSVERQRLRERFRLILAQELIKSSEAGGAREIP